MRGREREKRWRLKKKEIIREREIINIWNELREIKGIKDRSRKRGKIIKVEDVRERKRGMVRTEKKNQSREKIWIREGGNKYKKKKK